MTKIKGRMVKRINILTEGWVGGGGTGAVF